MEALLGLKFALPSLYTHDGIYTVYSMYYLVHTRTYIHSHL